MIRPMLVALLTSVCLPTFASWVQLHDSEDRTYYIDLESVRKDGYARTFWRMTNYKQRTPYGDMSARSKEVINCKNETKMTLSFTTFTQQNLGGAVTTDFTPKVQWDHIPPRTLNAEIMRLVCSK